MVPSDGAVVKAAQVYSCLLPVSCELFLSCVLIKNDFTSVNDVVFVAPVDGSN